MDQPELQSRSAFRFWIRGREKLDPERQATKTQPGPASRAPYREQPKHQVPQRHVLSHKPSPGASVAFSWEGGGGVEGSGPSSRGAGGGEGFGGTVAETSSAEVPRPAPKTAHRQGATARDVKRSQRHGKSILNGGLWRGQICVSKVTVECDVLHK